MHVIDVPTASGLARARVTAAARPRALLVLGHGAGGSIDAPDLVAVRDAAVGDRVTVALVEQPYRVAGKRSAAPAPRLDAAWIEVVRRLREEVGDLPHVSGGRSSGARVACRTAAATGARGVVCLAFPLHPPTRRPGAEPKTRLPELDAVAVPVLVVQGTGDRFGMPPARADRVVVEVPGDHSLRRDPAAVAEAVRAWLRTRPE